MAKTKINRMGIRTQPATAAIAPFIPRNLYPIEVAILTANTPGIACDRERTSRKSLFDNH